jgi:exodeoxyribonuclease VII small subunit
LKPPDDAAQLNLGSKSAAAETPAGNAGMPAPRFEDSLRRLEQLVEELESGDLALEDSIARFEEGQTLLRMCTELLDKAELQVREVLRRADGTLTARALELEETDGV